MVNEHSQWHADLPAEHSDEEVLNPEKVLVLFASETGNAQDTAERVGREIRRRGGRCTVQSMEDFDIVRNLDLMTYDYEPSSLNQLASVGITACPLVDLNHIDSW